MTSQIIRNSALAPASLISFNLLNDKERNTLYLLGGAQPLALEVTNVSDGNLTFGTSSQLILSFRPGTLTNTSNIQVEGSDWSLDLNQDMVVSLVFKPTTDVVLEPNQVLKLNLTGIEGDNRAGSHPSQVELKLRGVSSAGLEGEAIDYALNTFTVLNAYPGAASLVDTANENASEAKNSAEEAHKSLNILQGSLNQLQDNFSANVVKVVSTDISKNSDNIQHNANLIANLSKDVKPPFRVDIVNGSNTILNDDISENRLTLRISTTDPATNGIQVQADTARVIFDFKELGPINGATGGIPAVEAEQWRPKSTSFNGMIATIDNPSTPYLESSYFDVKLTFKCSGAAGSGRLKISYFNLNGTDGDIYLLLYKSPLAIGRNTVGIGTLPGTEKLKVTGDVAIDGYLSVKAKTNEEGALSVTGASTLNGNTTIDGTLQIGAALTICDGKVSSNPAPPEGYRYTQLQGAVNITSGKDSNFANTRGFMAPGSLTIGSTDRSYGGGMTGWNLDSTTGTAGLLLETQDNTEIAVHDVGKRLASFMNYDSVGNSFTIGRDMGGGKAPSEVGIAGKLTTPELQLGPNLRIRWVQEELCGPQYAPDWIPKRWDSDYGYVLPRVFGYYEVSIDLEVQRGAPDHRGDGIWSERYNQTYTFKVEAMDLFNRLTGLGGGYYGYDPVTYQKTPLTVTSRRENKGPWREYGV